MLQTKGEDYYDIPDDELPSANFAARPMSEISNLSLLDIDGLWTFMSFASTSTENTDSKDDCDDGPTPTALAPETPFMPSPEMPRTPPDTPAIEVTPPSRRKSLRLQLKRMSGVASIVRNSSMRQKADTAPPGALSSPEYSPQVPRRAVSAKLQKRPPGQERHSRHMTSESDLKARNILGLNESSFREERRGLAGGPWGEEKPEEEETLGFLHPNTSFSRKPRVRETLEKKQLSRLRMDFVPKVADELVDSPHSMLDTPEELYPAPQPQPQSRRFRTTSAIHGKRGTSTPVSPKTPSPFLRPQPLLSDSFGGDESLEDLYRTRVYVSGPVCLEQHPAMLPLRKNSIATLDPFTRGIDSIGRRPSDLLALEQIVVYFDGMGMGEPTTDECLDRYWLDSAQQAVQETAMGVAELEPLTLRSQQSGSSKDALSALSKFSFSSASSGASVQQDSPQKRQLIRLKRLLLPALPGLKGFDG